MAFLKARLDEDEAAAGAALEPAPLLGDTVTASWHSDVEGCCIQDDANGWVAERVPSRAVAAHIALNDPARVLREVAAKRALIDAIFGYEATIDGEWGDGHGPDQIAAGMCPDHLPDEIAALLALAAVYSDHPDYDPAWRP